MEIVLRSGKRPLIRAGWANGYFFILYCFYSVIGKLLVDLSIPLPVRILTIGFAIVYTIWRYKINISRIIIKQNVIHFENPFYSERLSFDKIQTVIIKDLPGYAAAKIKVKVRGQVFSRRYDLGPNILNILAAKEAAQRLGAILIDRKVQVIEK